MNPRFVRQSGMRQALLLGAIMLGFALIVGRSAYLQLIVSDRLQMEGEARFVRTQTIPANRGIIKDRHENVLAVSTPVDSVLAVPDIVMQHAGRLPDLASELEVPPEKLQGDVERYASQGRRGVLLKRQLTPTRAQQITDLDIPGISLIKEYKRFYPNGVATSNLLGFTSVDDVGIEALELSLNSTLEGQSGLKKVLNDERGRSVEKLSHIRNAKDGTDVTLSIDVRIQQILYNRLMQTIAERRAAHATGVVVDPSSGEILAIATAPGFNPHQRREGTIARNRAVTDVFEPGSVIKPILVAKALSEGMVTPSTLVDTSPGWINVQRHTVEDFRNYGTLSIAESIMKSSNVAMVKIGMKIPPDELIDFYQSVGFGMKAQRQEIMLGENSGLIPQRDWWRESEHATLAFGYGFATTPLQLVRVYSAIANDGLMMPLTILKGGNAGVEPQRVLPETVAAEITRMLEMVVSPTGTARRAGIPLYRVAGKTATIQKLIDGRYSSDQHIGVFVGFAPVSEPSLAMVVVVDDPQEGKHWGGVVAAPAFRDVVAASLRLLNLPPDELTGPSQRG